MRRILAVAASSCLATVLAIGVGSSAFAANVGTVTVSYDASAPSLASFTPTSLSGNPGDTFTFVNNRNNSLTSYISIANGTGSATLDGVSCASSTDCRVPDVFSPPSSETVTIISPGTFTIYRSTGGSPTSIGTLTISGGSGEGNIDPALVYPTATIDANGGTCTGSSQFIKAPGQNASSGTLTAPSASSCTRTNYSLRGWALSETATTAAFSPGATVPIGDESFTLYAVWEPTGVEIRYNANVGTSAQCVQGGSNLVGDARQSAPVVLPAAGAVATAAPCTPVDAQLVGWALTGDGPSVVEPRAALPASFTQGSSYVLYAKWRVVYGLTSSKESVSASSGQIVPVTFTATLNGAPAAGRSVELVRTGPLSWSSSGSDSVEKFTAITNRDGQVTVDVIATRAGQGEVSASFGNVSVSVPVTTTTAEQKTITIIGNRGTVSGNSGIIIEGASTGFAGERVVPYIRFPGQTGFTAGSARPEVGADGSFFWQRKTGKKTYVYFTSEDGTVTSNRVIIPAK